MFEDDHFINVCVPPSPPSTTTTSAPSAGAVPSFVEQYRLNKDGEKIIEVDPSVYQMFGIFIDENETIAELKEKIIAAVKKSHSKDPLKGILGLKSQKGSIMEDEKLAAHCFAKDSYVFVCRAAPRVYKKRVSDSAQPEAKKAKGEGEVAENTKESKESKAKEDKPEKVKKAATKTPKPEKLDAKKPETEKKLKKKAATKEANVVSPPPVTPTTKKPKATPTAKSAKSATSAPKKATPPPPPAEDDTDEEVVVEESEDSDESDGQDSD